MASYSALAGKLIKTLTIASKLSCQSIVISLAYSYLAYGEILGARGDINQNFDYSKQAFLSKHCYFARLFVPLQSQCKSTYFITR